MLHRDILGRVFESKSLPDLLQATPGRNLVREFVRKFVRNLVGTAPLSNLILAFASPII